MAFYRYDPASAAALATAVPPACDLGMSVVGPVAGLVVVAAVPLWWLGRAVRGGTARVRGRPAAAPAGGMVRPRGWRAAWAGAAWWRAGAGSPPRREPPRPTACRGAHARRHLCIARMGLLCLEIKRGADVIGCLIEENFRAFQAIERPSWYFKVLFALQKQTAVSNASMKIKKCNLNDHRSHYISRA